MSNWINIVKESRLVKALVYTTVGSFSYPGLAILNRLKITGMEDLRELPARNVLFVCNHQTYFTDVIALLHVFCAVSVGKKEDWVFRITSCGPIPALNLFRPKKQ